MASHVVCDIELCDSLKESMRKFFRREPTHDPDIGPIVAEVVRKNSPTRKSEMLNFRYCPYCGTRLAMGVVDSVGGVM